MSKLTYVLMGVVVVVGTVWLLGQLGPAVNGVLDAVGKGLTSR